MPRRVLARGRAVCACVLAAAAVAGCTQGSTGNSSVTATGKSLTIYLSAAPTSQPLLAADVLAAERLAFRQAFGQAAPRVGAFGLRLRILHGQISDQARIAIQDKSAIAYLGEVVPHSSFASLGITNALDLLQVSPTDTALELTQATPAVSGAPDIYYQSHSTYGQTFARVVPTSGREAKAQIEEMQSLGVSKLYVGDDGSPYGAAMASALRHDAAGKIKLAGSQAAADGAFYGTASPASAARFFARAIAANPSVKLFGPSALYDPTLAGRLSPAGRNLYISAPGFRPQDLDPAGSKFVSDFRAAYGRAPLPQAIFGYEAMAAVLAVLRQAGSNANNRSTVVHDFLALKNRQSALGTYSINADGDTSIAPFVFARVQRGKLVPIAQVQG